VTETTNQTIKDIVAQYQVDGWENKKGWKPFSPKNNLIEASE
jgi:hypothetical protein